ncbi:MAG: hypothetical protein EOL87_11810 [Spartobacteria bacterium]|nr:hypothetical protein [Spartobacteria bacterium]
MENCDANSTFARCYAKIEQSASEYSIVDYQQQPSVDYVIDFNHSHSIPALRGVLDDVNPEVILCMEMLEHVNYHFELMNELARAIALYSSLVFITLPNNGNWIFNALGWNIDHSIAFFKDIAYRFIQRSDLGKYEILIVPCMQKYLWYWPLAYALSFLQPFSWGFLVAPTDYEFSDPLSPVIYQLRNYTQSTVTT